MRIIIAQFFRWLFRTNILNKGSFYGVHKRIFEPLNLFKGVVCEISYNQLKLSLKIDDWIPQNLYFLGEYETAELNTLHQFLNKGSSFIDLGANLGLYTLNASQLVGETGSIISFEPFSENFNSLTKNLAINNLKNVRVEKLAVGEKAGLIKLFYDRGENNLGMVSTRKIENATEEEVEMISLDSYLKDKQLDKIDLIKIDIEGFEYSALLGMRQTLAEFKPNLLIEILKDEGSEDNAKRINDLLKDLGYHKYFIDDTGNLSPTETNSNRLNFVFQKEPSSMTV